MTRYKVTIEYDGTLYCGWQIQRIGKSIAATLEQAIYNFSGEKICIYGSGRTDSGVHALAQVAHFDLRDKFFETRKLTLATNFHLKKEQIIIIDTEIVDNDFHARFSATKRTYIYKILNRPSPTVIDVNRVWHVNRPLDISKMSKAANLLIGQHDFTSFRASQCQAKSPIKTIDSIIIDTVDDEIRITISAVSFLHHMVRNIVGSLKMVGQGYTSIEQFKQNFLAKNRNKMAPTAPAAGLYLAQIDY